MTEKNQQEKMAAERQVELFTKAFGKAKEDKGIWLDNTGRKAPGLYQKHLQVSAFNAIILGMHAAQNGYNTNQYTLFSEAKKRGESVQSKEKGVPFLWYNWNEYVNKHNPEDKISRADYQALPSDKQADYKGIRSREVRALFNIEQTTLPMVDKTAFEATVQEYGRLNDRKDVESASTAIRKGVEELLEKARENMVEIRSDSTGVAHYDSRMRKCGAEHGYNFNSHARQFQKSDFARFETIVVMDNENYRAITSMTSSESDRKKVVRMADFLTHHREYTTVPDPYYGDYSDFELVITLLEDACQELLDSIIGEG